MAKVIVERPRRGWDGGHKKPRQDLDALPTKVGMKREIIGEKYLNENLSPLRRFLASQVGRPWNKVYADISAYLRPANVVQQHVRSHLEDFVALNFSVNKDGELEQPHRWWWRGGRQSLYVDPRDGILKATLSEKDRKRRALARRQELAQKKANADTIVVDRMQELRRLNGVWFFVEYAPLPYPSPFPLRKKEGEVSAGAPNALTHYDVVLRAYVGPKDAFAFKGRYAVKKRQLASDELRRYRIQNVAR
ncbi:MAG: hypothetical protein EXR78_00260 [Deltaproteobacteria bacterium]|nr:hypothetical protein [Deltaproteobacteria bacterium]